MPSTARVTTGVGHHDLDDGPRGSTGEFVQFFLASLSVHRRCVVAIAVALLFLATSQGLFLLLVKGFVQSFFASAAAGDALSLSDVMPKSVLEYFPALASVTVAREHVVMGVPTLILIAGLAKALATYVYALNQQALSLYVASALRDRMSAAVLALPYLEIKKLSPGAWMSHIMNDVMFLQGRFSDIMSSFVRGGVLVLSCLVFMFFIHWPTAVFLAVASPLVALTMGRTGKRIAFFAEAFQRELSKITAAALDVRSRFDFVRAQHGEPAELRRFESLNGHYYDLMRRSIFVRSVFAPVLEFAGFGLFAFFVYVVGHRLWGFSFTGDVLLQFFVALGLLLKPLREIGEQFARFHETKGSFSKTMATFRQVEALGPKVLPADRQGADFRLDRPVTINGISAGFGGGIEFATQNIVIVPGQTTAIIGPSGAGKSTFVRTLAGLLPPLVWQSQVSWQELSSTVSMVSQEPFLFDDTLAANLMYGQRRQVNGQIIEKIWAALELVNVADDIRHLPEGLDTRVRAITANLSGGQIQRLVIARALLWERKILALDEATSAVDAKSERDILARLVASSPRLGMALFAVTHRLQWLEMFNEVWFVESGKVVLKGPHVQLMATARYRDFCQSAGG